MQIKTLSLVVIAAIFMSSCVSKKKMAALKDQHKKEMDLANEQLGKCGQDLNKYIGLLAIKQP
jgi:PBP1b-binding outer membrane lipoprotein LpoB